uniref:Microfibrillar-associated protein 1 n=1 Tax=Toxocara canis TaxID=6265 RepID=A0A183UY91_TOXCA
LTCTTFQDHFSGTITRFGSERRSGDLRRGDERQRQRSFEELRRESRFRDGRREQDVLLEEEEEENEDDIEEVEEYREERNQSYQRRGVPMSVDYTPTDFNHSLTTIEAASREGVRVRRHGDTTILTEHRDPYSFYWQLDQARKPQDEPPRLVFLVQYIHYMQSYSKMINSFTKNN